ncbi:transposase [Weissella confusa]|uniref:transposase n=4 Tax=Lactobacillaceae TaxID=33958 RepID=UPI003BF5BF1A
MSIRYSQDFKDSLVKLHQEGRSLKSLAEEFGPSKDSIAIWVKQATPVMIQGQSKTLKDITSLLAQIVSPNWLKSWVKTLKAYQRGMLPN